MLERTAASLESCSLQRVLPKPTKTCRRLHTAFWQHGASAIELSSNWPGPSRSAELEATDGDLTAPQAASLMASAFVLDFLYPATTLPLLRRIYPKLPRTEYAQPINIAPRRRQFSSSSADPALTPTIARPAEETGDIAPISDSTKALIRLDQLLSDEHGDNYTEVWDLYHHLDFDSQVTIRPDVVMYLVQSHGIVENGRALSIFRQIPAEELDNDLLASGVLLFLRAGDLPSAVREFRNSLGSKGLLGGLEYLMADAITSRKWDVALDVWEAYYAAEVKAGRKPNTRRLKELGGIPNQGNLYFAFRSFLVTDGAKYYRRAKQNGTSNAAFRLFRRHFASMALMQPCPPDQAALILESLSDKELYIQYFELMLNRGKENLETKSNMNKLPKMYGQFRQLPDAVPTMNMLHGMFKICYPRNMAGLEQVYRDWIDSRGALNKWGYEKFLKLHATRGDVAMVEKLWVDYAEKYPEMLKTPRGFRSILNVYAQVSDAAQAEKVIHDMINKHGAKPDIDSYNMLIKAYVRANDYDKALAVFDNVSQTHEPDSWTYTHAMAMTSKKGDLETTLDLFNRSQQAGVPVTKEMSLALVVAYCQNELLDEAESLCVELAQRGLTHTTIWNQLINFNGEARNITKCQQLLERMKGFGIDWDEDTYRFLLQALVNVDQIHAAFSLLKAAQDESLFIISPEHYAIVMAGAARCGQHKVADALHLRLKSTGMRVNFSAWVAVVESATHQKPGVDHTLNLGKEFVSNFRQAMAASQEETAGQVDTPNTVGKENELTAIPRTGFQSVGRAIALLVQLREFGTAEDLMTVFNEMFPQFQEAGQYPATIVSALMLAHYKDGDLNKVMDLWEKSWAHILQTSKKSKGEGIYAGHEYDLSRVINVAMRAFRDKNNAQGLSECIDGVTREGFRLTNANWALAVRYLAELGRWDRAMYWCEKMLMPGWLGWNWGRTNKEKAAFRNTRALRAPKNVVFRLQQEWLKLRKVAAWDGLVSRQLENVADKYPRLYQAFTTSDIETLQMMHQVDKDRENIRDLDKVLRSMPYEELMKAKEALLKQLMKERRREKRLGIETAAPKSPEQHLEWKKELHNRIRRYAAIWAERRQQHLTDKNAASVEEDPEKVAAQERIGFWNNFFDRYDQRPHGDSRPEITIRPRRESHRRQKSRASSTVSDHL